jgi:multidrug resistance efflux pump
LDILLEKLEKKLIDDDDFKKRYDVLKAEIRGYETQEASIEQAIKNQDMGIKNLEASFSEINKFSANWEMLDDAGKSL